MQFDYDAARHLMKQLRTSDDAKFIATVISKKNAEANYYLAENPHLTKEQVDYLSREIDTGTRGRIAKRDDLTTEILQTFYRDTDDHVRFSAICNPLTPFKIYKDYVLNGKLTGIISFWLVCNDRCVEASDVFQFLWDTYKSERGWLIRTANKALREKRSIDAGCVYLIHNEIEKGKPSIKVREAYAEASHLAIPKILDELKKDPARPVVNAVAKNSAAWGSTHEYLVNNHKTPAIRISVATVTKDNDLLNKIYHGTKSKDIRDSVVKNPIFIEQKD